MSGDRLVAIVGIVMSLILVLANRRFRQQALGTKAWMVGVWLVIIVAVAVLFSQFRR